MLIVNTETIAGYQIIEVRGLVQGSTVRAKHIGRDIGASLKGIIGGELKAYTEMMSEARTEAVARLDAEAAAIGANAVVNLRFATADVVGAGAEILAYGTAVVAQPI
ncbi:MAG: heavy metal-binding domain-containing protein [Actinomycetia bacterium]|nr:heavy metal-binding domain-containing protein [Actinomycetes bacterium]